MLRSLPSNLALSCVYTAFLALNGTTGDAQVRESAMTRRRLRREEEEEEVTVVVRRRRWQW